MAANIEQIPVFSDDIQALDRAGIRKDDIAGFIHDFAENVRHDPAVHGEEKHSGLTPAEVAILEEGGAFDAQDGPEATAVRGLSALRLEMTFLIMRQNSLSGNEIAKRLGISPARVRQLAAPANPGLHAFSGKSDERRFPVWQINGGSVLPHLRKVLKAMSPDVHPLTVYRFMTASNPDLETPELEACPSPREWLIAGYRPDPVIELARDL